MQNIVNQQCMAGGNQCLYNTSIRYRWKQSVVIIHFNLLKKAKNVLDAKNNNFYFLRF